MNLKKKVIFGMIAGFFAVATVFNLSMLNDNGAGDVSLEDIAVMAEAQDSEEPIDENYDSYGNYPLYVDVCTPCTNSYGDSGIKFSCELGWGWCEIDYYSFNCTYGFC